MILLWWGERKNFDRKSTIIKAENTKKWKSKFLFWVECLFNRRIWTRRKMNGYEKWIKANKVVWVFSSRKTSNGFIERGICSSEEVDHRSSLGSMSQISLSKLSAEECVGWSWPRIFPREFLNVYHSIIQLRTIDSIKCETKVDGLMFMIKRNIFRIWTTFSCIFIADIILVWKRTSLEIRAESTKLTNDKFELVTKLQMRFRLNFNF